MPRAREEHEHVERLEQEGPHLIEVLGRREVDDRGRDGHHAGTLSGISAWVCVSWRNITAADRTGVGVLDLVVGVG